MFYLIPTSETNKKVHLVFWCVDGDGRPASSDDRVPTVLTDGGFSHMNSLSILSIIWKSFGLSPAALRVIHVSSMLRARLYRSMGVECIPASTPRSMYSTTPGSED